MAEGVAAEEIDKGDLVYFDNHYVRCVADFVQLDCGNNYKAVTSAKDGFNVTVKSV